MIHLKYLRSPYLIGPLASILVTEFCSRQFVKDALQYWKESPPEKAEDSTRPLSNGKTLSQEQRIAAEQIRRVFKDLGSTRKVRVLFNEEQYSCAGVVNTLEHGKRVANVFMPYPNLNFLKQQERIYAIAGHEAVHSIHEHPQLKSIFSTLIGPLLIRHLWSLTRFNPVVRILSMLVWHRLLYNAFSQLVEVEADITSADKLGSAKELRRYFEEMLEVQEEMGVYPDVFENDHPDLMTRICYLKDLYPNASLSFFKPIVTKKISSETPTIETPSSQMP